MMNKKIIAGVVVVALIIAVATFWLVGRHDGDKRHLTLHGNVDIRQVSLAFEDSGRISTLTVDEGDQVRAGQVIATLDTRALKIQEQQAQAQLDAQKQTVREQQAGARPEELAQARAQLSSAQAQLQKATEDISRIQRISASTGGKGVSKQELDTARSNLRIAQANVKERQASLTLMEKGVRSEQREASVAQVRATEAQLALMQYHLSQAELRSPVDAVVRARLQEPGDMTGPQKAVYTLALSKPKWVRVWLNEGDLGRVKSGMPAEVFTDSFPDKPVTGKVGFISSVAEFTPKSVQTEDLRTNLVFEVRIVVDDPDNVLRMGQPATVTINTQPENQRDASN
ncbi:HlyD family efflux transporter periplasmic adaptor subunit [Serratia grimesii]|jgi:HlyD family secretion protein|uniref:HlyD family efflux transporter periplasmic adaptor subunit n=1 Tax=Serratia grimesii TaxID=82995 RepID=UPI00076F3CA6|nr:HlyD family efflux transporter periplasmic adaptor subunit [Serratia grimesii]CAI0762999.1 Macrolide-specific efflux protein macA precursor [Serratia grimesii]CAI0923582.1 Macrolide-specific efflux protein macA precursor [Serratia grimesii]CAI2409360.1 Macrolide-specific efflux protein macA precursor [Serratia grimesii]CUW22234.1 Multidrug resistance protein MdtN [Serratia grimesii]SMZ57528.1 Multidrug resistance protein MdtN [Serratia grimesii]